jgi:hypothetical protein
MADIFQRIGEAIASQGKITVVVALNDVEEKVLQGAGFKMVGTMELNGSVLKLFEVKIQQIINAPSPGVWNHDINKPKKYVQEWPEGYRMYSTGTGSDNLIYKGSTTSLMDAAYNPLSILEDYFFPNNEETPKTTVKISLGDLSSEDSVRFANAIKDEFQKSGRLVSDDSWTSYQQGYQGDRQNRNW